MTRIPRVLPQCRSGHSAALAAAIQFGILVATLAGATARAEDNPQAAALTALCPALAEDHVYATGTGGFILETSKRASTDHGANIGLKAKYDFGTTAGIIDGTDAGCSWRITFKDMPRTSDSTVKLLFLYERTAAEKKQLADDIQALLSALVLETAKGLDTCKTDMKCIDEFAVPTAALGQPLKNLDSARAANDQTGLELVLASIGASRSKDGKIPLGKEIREKLAAAAGGMVSLGYPSESVKELGALSQPANDECARLYEASKAGTDTAKAILVMRTCLGRLGSAHCPKAGVPVPAVPDAVQDVVQAELSPWLAACSKEFPTDKTSPAYHDAAYDYLAATWGLEYLKQAEGARSFVETTIQPIAKSLDILALELERAPMVRSELGLAVDEKAKWFDVATGVLYVADLEDVVVPVLVSVCPLGGCLRSGEVTRLPLQKPTWSTARTWAYWFAHSLSVDLGIRAVVLDSTNWRQKGKVALLFGASWNPVDVVRFSAGSYFFDDAKNGKWSHTWYMGITLNLLHAAEILGPLGIPIPKIEAAGSTSK